MRESTTKNLKVGELFCFEEDGSVFMVMNAEDLTISYDLWCSHSAHDTLHDIEARDDTKVFILNDDEAAKHETDPGKQSS